LVPIADAGYVAWLAAPNHTPTLATMAELEATLRNSYPAGTLRTYAADARYRKASGGLTMTSISSVPFLTDPVARNTLANANEYAKVTPHTTDWKLSDGSFIPLSPAQLATATSNMANFVQACFTKESQTLASINSGTITTIAQIDAAFAAISNVVP
jgi:hypothetical protein